ncbi:zinc-dependent alcohol dehydrogenase family protein [Paraflavitalea pollutisoli]|uniref:zinc-dependent alcohol dehydrogenase family protein n=1 Tax=Paraflavitalea pollutisoli TaxID=3034143 RepID=UPI0023ECADDE|nr:NAD(P)-dependent alcohol dehydrogenase [Paraflavitalea sp. H1-2-19X]
MKAIHLAQFGIDHLRAVDLPTPTFTDDEVLVRTTAVALEYHDLLVIENRLPFGIPLPHIPVSEGVGIVEAVGSRVTRWQKGDRVMIPFIGRWEAGRNTPYNNAWRTGFTRPGLLAEYTVQPEHTLVRTPANLTDEAAASLPVCGLTAWTVLIEKARIRPGQTILVQGSGGVSLYALQIARLCGLRVIATTSSPEKAERLRELGAETVISYKEYPNWSEEVRKANGGIGVDVTLDIAGTDTIAQSTLSVKEHGFVGLIGLLTGLDLTMNFIPLISNYVRLQAYSVGNAQELGDFVKAIEVNNLQPVVDGVYPFDQVKAALYRYKSGEAFGKVVVAL